MGQPSASPTVTSSTPTATSHTYPPGAVELDIDPVIAGRQGAAVQVVHLAVGVVREVQRPGIDVQHVAAALVAVGDEHTSVAALEVERRTDRARPGEEQLERAVAVEGGGPRQDPHGRPEEPVPLGADGVAHVARPRRGGTPGSPTPPPPTPSASSRTRSGCCRRQVDQLGGVGRQVVQLPLVVAEWCQRLVQGDDLPPVPVVAAAPGQLVVLLTVRRRSVG